MNSTRNLAADDLQLKLTNAISLVSTVVNVFGFYIILVQKTQEQRSFTFAQLLYQVLLYLSQFYAGTVLNIVFMFPIPGAYCIGWLRELTDLPALLSFILFDILFAFQGVLIAVLMLLKADAIARPFSPFKMRPFKFRAFIVFITVSFLASQTFVLLATYEPRADVVRFLINEHPQMVFLLRYPFLWMLTTTRHFIALASCTIVSIGLVLIVFVLAYIFLFYELALQVNSMSRASNKYHKKIARELVIHTSISLQFFILIPFLISIRFFLDMSVDTSIFSAFTFSIFVSAPIPSMMVFILKNSFYRSFVVELLRFGHKKQVATVGFSNTSRVSGNVARS